MNRLAAGIAILLVVAVPFVSGLAQNAERPRILGIDHVTFYTTDADGVRKLYGEVLGLASAAPVEGGGTLRYFVGRQWVGYSAAPDPKINDRMDHVAFATENIVAMRRYLIAKGVNPVAVKGGSDHSLSFMVADPEGHRIEFVERGKGEVPAPPETAVSHHMIHAGFIVYNREIENHFYREILGFRPYWHGGMKDGETDWEAIQVPDGTDWLEYMLNQPPHPSSQTAGVMNHISLGVVDMKKAQALLESHGWKAHGDEHAQMGKDGKWQLNLYDTDFTRVELMEFKPVEKPCCSEFTGPHPTE
jgi:catechol 2,3-dioxygenase-like lactoylglutathione lyase family enzyme